MPAYIWIVIAAAVLALFIYYDRDDHECSVCGARFRQDTMTCPRCGARFDAVKKDEREFIEEMTDEDDWDGEDG